MSTRPRRVPPARERCCASRSARSTCSTRASASPAPAPAGRAWRAPPEPVGRMSLEELSVLQGEGVAVLRHHHEGWDGGGYPGRLGGERIPLGARIFALADARDAITSACRYRGARPWREAVAVLSAQA